VAGVTIKAAEADAPADRDDADGSEIGDGADGSSATTSLSTSDRGGRAACAYIERYHIPATLPLLIWRHTHAGT